ncbi:MAG: response regulator transcription factor [Candidatus Izemoplasmataceae bacterium]
MKNILVLEDHKEINQLITKTLEEENYTVFSAFDAFHALDLFHQEKIDLIITDLMLPIKSGESFIKEVRKTSSVQIIIISAKAALDDKLEGLKIGADDYLVKPFSKDELKLKINNYFKKQKSDKDVISLYGGDVVFSLSNNVLIIKDQEITLTAVEFQILRFLVMHKNKVVSRSQLLDILYDYQIDVYDRVIDTHIKNIRQKVRALYDFDFIKTVYGLGYILVGEKND